MTNSALVGSETEEYVIELVGPQSWPAIKEQIMQLEFLDFSPSGLDEDEEELGELFTNPITICYVIRNRQGIVGYLTAGPLELFDYLDFIRDDSNFGKSNTSYLSSVAVHPEHQGKGLGKRLILALIETARRKGYSRITGHFLDVSELMFHKLGGNVMKEYPNWYGDGNHATYMELGL